MTNTTYHQLGHLLNQLIYYNLNLILRSKNLHLIHKIHFYFIFFSFLKIIL